MFSILFIVVVVVVVVVLVSSDDYTELMIGIRVLNLEVIESNIAVSIGC